VRPERLLAQVTVYTAVTFLATVVLVVETPATGGYFNLGEAAIYSIAFLAHPVVAGLAAGVGPALADVVLGFGYYAPATMVIKFAEGFTVSSLARRLATTPRLALALATIAVAVCFAAVVAAVLGGGGGEVSAVLSTVHVAGIEVPSVDVKLPAWAWYLVALLIVLVAVAAAAERTGRLLAMMVGGMIMVTGYFLYQFTYVNPVLLGRDPWTALFEVPVNIGQASVGAILAYPVVQFVERARAGQR
jgi:uncharacterized membrane protein